MQHSIKTFMKIQAIIHSAEEGGYWAEVPALPGCVTQADTLEELTEMLKEAVEGWLDAMTIPEENLGKESQILEINI
jgi:predicted RNase H-like HicB family nuclease